MLKFVICGIFLLYLVQCNFGSEVEDIDNKTIKMPEKKWADYKVGLGNNLLQKNEN